MVEVQQFNSDLPSEFAGSAVEVDDERQVATVVETAEGRLGDLGTAAWEVRHFSEDVGAPRGRKGPAYLGSERSGASSLSFSDDRYRFGAVDSAFGPGESEEHGEAEVIKTQNRVLDKRQRLLLAS